MLAINTIDIISESTDLGDTVVGKRSANRVVTATTKTAAILDRIALLDLPCYGADEHRVVARARIALHGALLMSERVARTYTAPLTGGLNRRSIAY
ncbi:hypothetical protein LCGC14_1987190 [marine sediment metagenome]|uniref:Uncharacterized protein n=1 Tax=marine sediment metagenome TaxID=412755 RepID=A0A0F9FV60_9ZZZZ